MKKSILLMLTLMFCLNSFAEDVDVAGHNVHFPLPANRSYIIVDSGQWDISLGPLRACSLPNSDLEGLDYPYVNPKDNNEAILICRVEGYGLVNIRRGVAIK